ncbi:MAG: outer membrane beta-barrel protein [Deltaproteobacteria bacterium]|nr:outer membrane beta-barrel protein [Deltaproteobacteria bacterium]MBW2218291.1 outer membrane beta-barrel protein [Deltaproteobacteria bacterium]
MYKIFILLMAAILIPSAAFAEEGGISGNIFGGKTGMLHPYLSLSQQYTSNVFKVKDNVEGDFITAVSPGLWMAVPGTKEKMVEIDTTNTAPGGLSLSRRKPETFRRYQTYFLYSPEFQKYWEYTDEDITSHRVEGAFQYNLRGGLSIDFADLYLNGYELMGEGISNDQAKFWSNLFNLMLSYDITNKVGFRVDFSLFSLDYKNDVYSAADRTDSFIAWYTFYRMTEKMSIFAEIEYTDINYDISVSYDSVELRYFTGVKWDITAKSRGEVKVGYGRKNFDSSDIESAGDFVMELKIDHTFTPKTSVGFTILRRTNETTIADTDYAIVNSFAVEYLQKFTERISGNAELLYMSETYEGAINYGDSVKERSDNRFRLSLTGKYEFNERYFAEAGYSYTRRDSNVSVFDYSDNTVTISATGTF